MKTNIGFWSYLVHFFLESKNVFETKFVEKIETHIFYSITFFDNRVIYEIVWKNGLERGRPQMTMWRMRIACLIPRAINTDTGCVILITFPLQQWLNERALMLRCAYIACIL